jgi:DNA-binding transcriptional MerR regulator
MTLLRAGQVASAAGVNLETLRYYERLGVLPEPDRTLGGQRQYGPEAVTTVRIVKALQRLGFTLAEVSELLQSGRHQHRSTDPALQEAITPKIIDIDQRIADLQAVRASLLAAITAGCEDLTVCAGTPACPLPFTELDRASTAARVRQGVAT